MGFYTTTSRRIHRSLLLSSCTTCNHRMPRIGQDNILHELAHNRFPHLSTLLMTHNSGDPVSPPFPVCAFSNLQECQPWTVLSLGGFLSSWGRFHFMSCSCQMCYWVLREYTPDGSQQVYCSLHFTTWSLSCWRTQFHLTTPHSSPLHMLLIMYTHNVVPCKRTTFTFTLSQLSLSIEYWHIQKGLMLANDIDINKYKRPLGRWTVRTPFWCLW